MAHDTPFGVPFALERPFRRLLRRRTSGGRDSPVMGSRGTASMPGASVGRNDSAKGSSGKLGPSGGCAGCSGEPTTIIAAASSPIGASMLGGR